MCRRLTMRIDRLVLNTIYTLLFLSLVTVSTANAQTAGAAILARDEPVEAAGRASVGGGQGFGGAAGGSTNSRSETSSNTAAKKATASRPATPVRSKPWNGFVVGDKYTFLNFEVISAEKPYHTREAKANGAK